MTVEVATYPSQLDATLPSSTDLRSEGDNHMRLLKSVLQSTFPGLTRAVYFNELVTVAKAANYTILPSEGGKLFVFTPTVARLTATLPAGLTADDAGWSVYVTKGNSSAFALVASAGANFISRLWNGVGLNNVRCCIPGFPYKFTWNGVQWVGSRPLGVPIGTLLDYAGTTLPAGFEWPNGQVLATAADYPDYNSWMGGLSTLDLRGRVGLGRDDMGGAAAGRVGSVIVGTGVGNTGGSEVVTLLTAHIPSHTHINTLTDLGHTHGTTNLSAATVLSGIGGGQGYAAGGTASFQVVQGFSINAAPTGITINNAAAGGGGAHSNLQPSIVVNKILVVE